MDGLEATRRIRQLPGCSQLPIIALTANAFDDDREVCRQAGMDDFVAKPFESEVLFTKMLRLLPATPPPQAQPTHAAPVPPEASEPAALQQALDQLRLLQGLDLDTGLHYAHGKPRFFLRLLGQFARSTRYAELEACLARGDRDGARIAAHSLKSMAATVGAVQIRKDAAALEQTLAAAPDASGVALTAEGLDLPRVATAFHALAAQLLQILDAEGVPDAIEPAPDDGAAAQGTDWPALLELLDAGDVRAKAQLAPMRSALEARFGHSGLALLQSVDQYEFKEAAALLRQLLADRGEAAAQPQ